MKPLMITADIAAVGAIIGASLNFLPAFVGLAAGLLACVWYGFVIYDRIKYGPELDSRQRQHRRDVNANK